MSILDDIKAAWKQESEGDPTNKLITMVVAGVFSLIALFVIGVFLLIMWEIAKALFIPACIGVLVYALGVRFFDWPLPAFAKKFIK